MKGPKRKPAKAKPAKPPKGGGWHVLVVDSAPFRKKTRSEYEKLAKSVDGARAQIEEFEKQHRPGYDRWYNSVFGAKLTELRELQSKLYEKENLIEEIESYVFVYGLSHGEAYAKVQARLKGEWTPKPPPSFEEIFGDLFGEEDDEGGPAEPGERKGPQKEFEFGDSDEGDPWASDSGRGKRHGPGFPGGPPGASAPPPPRPRLKELYRELVRRLHPDKHANVSPKMLEMWHLTQKAYQAGDEEQLEVILTMSEIDVKGAATVATVSVLLRIISQFRQTLRSLRRELSGFRNHPAWNFAQVDRNVLQKRIARDLDGQAMALRRRLEFIELELREIEEESAREAERAARRKKKKKSGPYSGQSPF